MAHGQHHHGHRAAVDMTPAVDGVTPDRSARARHAVFISGIPARTPEEEIREHFKKCGIVVSLKLWPDRKHLAWYAVVTFQNEADARRSISSPAPIKGAVLRMAYAR